MGCTRRVSGRETQRTVSGLHGNLAEQAQTVMGTAAPTVAGASGAASGHGMRGNARPWRGTVPMLTGNGGVMPSDPTLPRT